MTLWYLLKGEQEHYKIRSSVTFMTLLPVQRQFPNQNLADLKPREAALIPVWQKSTQKNPPVPVLGCLWHVLYVPANISKESTYGWDEVIPVEFSKPWQQWLKDLDQLGQISSWEVCVKPKNFGQVQTVQLRNLCQARKQGYDFINYLRFINGCISDGADQESLHSKNPLLHHWTGCFD